MRGVWAALAVLFLLPLVSAFDQVPACQYMVPANCQKTVEQVVASDGRVLGDFIDLGEPTYYLDETGCGFEIAVTNKEDIPMRITILWRINLTDSTGPHVISDSFDGKNLAPHEKAKIQRSYPNTVVCTLLLPTLSYTVHDTASVDIKTVQENVICEACKMCNGVVCLNDGEPCDVGTQCGSKSCYNGACIGRCPADDKSCVGLCSDVEACAAGICDLNRGVCSLCVGDTCDCSILSPDHIQCPDRAACILPSSKKNGKGYACTKECISGYGEEGVCMITPDDALKRNVYWGVGVVVLVIVLGLGIKYRMYNKGVRSKRDELDKATRDLAEKEQRLRDAEADLKAKGGKLAETEAKIDELERQALHATGEVRKKVESALAKEKERRLEEFENINKEKELIAEEKENIRMDKEKLAQEKKNNDVAREEIDKESHNNYIKKQAEKYIKEYGTGVYYDRVSGRFKIKYPDNEYWLHVHIYTTKIRRLSKGKEEVHHIDNDELNNDLWNLIALDKIQHNKEYVQHCREKGIPHLIHSKIDRGKWESGMQQLHDQLGMEEKDFQENKYILQHMKELNFSFK